MTLFTPGARLLHPGPDVPSNVSCDGRVAGVIITHAGRLLMFERATFPAGLAPVAGHLDAHGSALDAAVIETWQEVGLRLRRENLTVVEAGWRPGLCRRTPLRQGPDAVPDGGHHWTIFTAEASGNAALDPDEREARRPRWMTPVEVAERALLTCQWAAGEVDDDSAFGPAPAVEPVWVRPIAQWFVDQGHARLAMPLTHHLDRIDALWTPRKPGTC